MVNFYIDSADRAIATPLLKTGLFRGLTTNPAILDRAGLGSRDIPDVIHWALDAGAEQVFIQAWGESVEDFVGHGEDFRAISSQVVVKVPMTRDGVTAARILSAHGDVLVTAVHSASQVLPIAASGAKFAATYVARMEAAGRDGVKETIAAHQALTAVGARTDLLAGSLRSPAQILALTQAGVQHMTLSPAVWEEFFDDAVTAAAIQRFQELATGFEGEVAS